MLGSGDNYQYLAAYLQAQGYCPQHLHVYNWNTLARSNGEVARLDFSRFEGRLAERFEFDATTRTWTFHLRRGVRGCTGNELTADDVIYTFARAKSVSGAAPIGWFLASTGGVAGFTSAVFESPAARVLDDSVRRIDRYTVAIRQAGDGPLMLPALATFGLLIFDSRELQRRATPADPWAHEYVNNVTAPGFGAYCVERWAKGNEMILRANPRYYRGPPAIGRVAIKRVPQSSNRCVLMRMGEAHLAERLTPKEYRALRERGRTAVSGTTGNESLFLHMNFRAKPFDDVRVRQAIAHAVPYDRIIRDGYYAELASSQVMEILGVAGLEADGARITSTSLHRAKTLVGGQTTLPWAPVQAAAVAIGRSNVDYDRRG